MTNQNAHAARQFHESTKLTYINLRNKPPLYKSYPGLPLIPLPGDKLALETPALPAVAGQSDSPAGTPALNALNLNALAQLLYYSCGVIRKAWLRTAGEVHYRAAASAGALYPIEAYVVCAGLPGLAAGVYHFAPESFALRKLRSGDYRRYLAEAAGGEETIAGAPVTIVFSSVFWRSSWKYRSRGYRYCHWDNGTVVANLLAAATAAGLPARVSLGFVDHEVDRLVGADGHQEASICLVTVGAPESGPPAADSPIFDAIPGNPALVFPDEVEYPDVQETHAATRLARREDAQAWKGQLTVAPPQPVASVYPLEPSTPEGMDAAGLGTVITSRGSTRRFCREPVPLDKFSSLLANATAGTPADFLGDDGPTLLNTYLIVNAVEGIAPGAYYYSAAQRQLHLVREGNFREESGHLCFEQALSADASAVAFIMADLGRVLEQFGDRGYRAAQLEAGILGGKLYLASYSLGLGASGITFFDDEVAEFFAPHSGGNEVMFVVTLGLTDEQNRVRPFRSRVAVKLDAQARGAGQY